MTTFFNLKNYQAIWGTYATFPFLRNSPLSLWTSPRTADMRELFPEPTMPTTAVRDPAGMWMFMSYNKNTSLNKQKQSGLGFYHENLTLKEVQIFAPQDFSPFFGEKLPKSSWITHMVTSNGGHPLHHHLRHSVRLSNYLFNRRTTKPTFTQWPPASAL